jgi:ATP-dependent Zn protease
VAPTTTTACLDSKPSISVRDLIERAVERSKPAAVVVYGKITIGAESDLQQLSQIARQMVGRRGMSEKLAPISLLPGDGQGQLILAPAKPRLRPSG